MSIIYVKSQYTCMFQVISLSINESTNIFFSSDRILYQGFRYNGFLLWIWVYFQSKKAYKYIGILFCLTTEMNH